MIASIVLGCYLLGWIPTGTAITSLFACAVLLLIAEFFIFSFGLFFVNAMLAAYAGYVLKTGEPLIMGIPIDWPLFYGIVFVELVLLLAVIWTYLKFKNIKPTTGIESMVGEDAEIVTWTDQTGQVRIQGENWKAISEEPLKLNKNDPVNITAIDGLTLKIKPKGD